MSKVNKLKSLRTDTKSRVFKEILIREVLLVHQTRGIPKFADGWLKTLRIPQVKDLSIILAEDKLEDLSEIIERHIRKVGKSTSIDMVNWLTSDITDHVFMFFASTGAQVVSLKIRQNGIQSNEAAYDGHIKMICNYGSEKIYWINTSTEDFGKSGFVDPLDVVLFKGKKWPGRDDEPYIFTMLETEDGKSSLLMELEYLG